jgi:MFS family permease
MADGGAQLLLDFTPWRLVSLGFAAAGMLLIPAILSLREPHRMEVRQQGGGSVRELWAYRFFLIPLLVGTTFLSGMSTGVLSWMAPALTRIYGRQPGDFAGWFGAVSLVSVLAGMLVGGRLSEYFRRREGRGSPMRPAALAAAACVPASFVAMMPDLIWFAAMAIVFTIAFAIAITIPMIVINFQIPNELRGVVMGLYVVTVSLGGALAAPLVATVSARFGGDAMLGYGMAAVGGPFALLAAACFWWASLNREPLAATVPAADQARRRLRSLVTGQEA